MQGDTRFANNHFDVKVIVLVRVRKFHSICLAISAQEFAGKHIVVTPAIFKAEVVDIFKAEDVDRT